MVRFGLVRRRGEGGVSWFSRMWGYSLEIVLKIQIALGRFFVWCVKPSGHCFCAW